jgi:hypothetical protein
MFKLNAIFYWIKLGKKKIKNKDVTSRGVELVTEPVVNVESRKAEHPKLRKVQKDKKKETKK